MDSLHAIGFYVSATLSLGGALFVAFLPARETRGLAMAVTGIGLAGIALSLSAGFAAAVVLVCYLAIAAILAGPQYRSFDPGTHLAWRQADAHRLRPLARHAAVAPTSATRMTAATATVDIASWAKRVRPSAEPPMAPP